MALVIMLGDIVADSATWKLPYLLGGHSSYLLSISSLLATALPGAWISLILIDAAACIPGERNWSMPDAWQGAFIRRLSVRDQSCSLPGRWHPDGRLLSGGCTTYRMEGLQPFNASADPTGYRQRSGVRRSSLPHTLRPATRPAPHRYHYGPPDAPAILPRSWYRNSGNDARLPLCGSAGQPCHHAIRQGAEESVRAIVAFV